MLQIQFLPTGHGSANEVRLVGELDRFSADTLLGLSQLSGDVELDCYELEVLDSGGLSALLALHTACDARGDQLTLYGFVPPATGFPGWYRVGMFDVVPDEIDLTSEPGADGAPELEVAT